MLNTEIPVKPRRKHLEVQVHKQDKDVGSNPKLKKTYSANFSSRKHRHKHQSSEIIPDHKVSELIIEIPEKDSVHRHCKKALSKEIERLTRENEDIVSKFNELEDLSVKRILKLKEKITNLQDVNEDISNQSEYIKNQYEELVKCYENVKHQLELSKICKSCEQLSANIKKLNEENDILKKKNMDLCNDLSMLKTVIYRLNVQLERYQEKLRKYNLSIEKSSVQFRTDNTTDFRQKEIVTALSGDHQNHRHTPISWGSVNSHTLGPLLDAYQDTINEKDDIIQSYEFEMAKFTGQMKEIVEENEELYRKLTEDENCSSKIKSQIDTLRDDLKLTKEQNDALIKKCALKQDKIEEILKVYENKVDQMKRDYQVLHDEYVQLRTENASLKDKIKSLLDSQDDFKNERQNYIPIAVHTASVNECKKWYEELKQQYENEKLKITNNLDSQTNLIKELNENIRILKQTKSELEIKVSKLERDLKKAETRHLDMEHTVNQVQLSRSACRKQLHKAMGFAKDMVVEQETLLRALNQRQLENRAVKKIGSEMAQRMDTLKTQLKDVQKSAWQEFSTVEQKIQEQNELIESMKEEHLKELGSLQAVIAEQEKQLSRHAKSGEYTPASPYKLFKDKYT
ncbi:uncharacterized protein LOC143200783 [Rhynchophorus ferrugineus]|uniref:uncharacterized protein LOC143200783 n=1 Tax=Rhynchophorus ferrugineus TaxID=354439 RepID=UPI003FCC637F